MERRNRVATETGSREKDEIISKIHVGEKETKRRKNRVDNQLGLLQKKVCCIVF